MLPQDGSFDHRPPPGCGCVGAVPERDSRETAVLEHIRKVAMPLAIVRTFDFASSRGITKFGAGDCTHSYYSPFASEPLLNRITSVIVRHSPLV